MVDYIKHWKIINNREFIGKININNNKIINKILMQLYLINNNDIDKKYFAIINCQEYKIINYYIYEFNNDCTTLLTELTIKMNKIDIKIQCIIIYHTDSNNNTINIVRYPNQLMNKDVMFSIDCFYKEIINYLPSIDDIKNIGSYNTSNNLIEY